MKGGNEMRLQKILIVDDEAGIMKKEFLCLIKEKSTYMAELINALGIAFRSKTSGRKFLLYSARLSDGYMDGNGTFIC